MLSLTLSASLVEAFLTASVLSAAAGAAQAPSWARRQSRGKSSEHWLPCAGRRTRQAGLKPLRAYGVSWAIHSPYISRVGINEKSLVRVGLRVRFGRVAGARGGRHTVNTDCRGIARLLLLRCVWRPESRSESPGQRAEVAKGTRSGPPRGARACHTFGG